MLDAGGRVGVVLVERLVLEQRVPRASRASSRFSASSATHLLVRLARRSAAPRRRSAPACAPRPRTRPGAAGPRPSDGRTASGPISSLIPQRPTIWRAISVSCWMSDSAPVVGSPKTTSSAARPPSATLILREQLVAVVVEAVGVGRGERDAERLAARDDRDLAHRVGARGEHPDDRVPALVVRGAAPVLAAHHHLPLGAEHDPLERVGEVGLVHLLVAAARGEQRRLVDEVREVGADHARASSTAIRPRSTSGAERHDARVHLEDRLAAVPVRRLHGDAPVEAARAAAAPGRARRAGSSRRSRSRRSTSRSRPSRSGSGSASARARRCRR